MARRGRPTVEVELSEDERATRWCRGEERSRPGRQRDGPCSPAGGGEPANPSRSQDEDGLGDGELVITVKA
jgi:hypothetical protein